MIKINLLPYRAARTKENIRRQVSIFLLLVILVVLSMSVYTVKKQREVTQLTTAVAQANAELVTYTKKAKEVDEINKKNKVLQQKTDVMNDLKTIRRDPVIMLSALSDLVVPERLWITDFETKGDQVTIKGVGLDEITVADFLKRMEQSEIYDNVNLSVISAKKSGEVKAKAFTLTCSKAKIKDKKANKVNSGKAIK